MDHQEGEATLGETTLEDFSVQAGHFVAETALAPTMELDSTTESFSHQIGSSLAPSIGMLSEPQDALEKKVKRKVKNRESAVESDRTPHQIGLSPTSSIGTLLDPPLTGRKRDTQDELEKRLRRKMKNRESAARSRARQQAYRDERASKVSRLEEDNLKLKKDKEFEIKFQYEPSEPKYQLRRTSSASF